MLLIQSADAKNNKGSFLMLAVTPRINNWITSTVWDLWLNKGSFLVLVIQSADAKNKGSFLMLAVTPKIKHQSGTSGSLTIAAEFTSALFWLTKSHL